MRSSVSSSIQHRQASHYCSSMLSGVLIPLPHRRLHRLAITAHLPGSGHTTGTLSGRCACGGRCTSRPEHSCEGHIVLPPEMWTVLLLFLFYMLLTESVFQNSLAHVVLTLCFMDPPLAVLSGRGQVACSSIGCVRCALRMVDGQKVDGQSEAQEKGGRIEFLQHAVAYHLHTPVHVLDTYRCVQAVGTRSGGGGREQCEARKIS
jgi:hypothetical protein